jgi:sec-independent protein translocase protein TatB
MLDFGFSEILLTSAIALVVLGPERLPKVARQVGNWMGRARLMARQLSEQLEREVNAEELLRQHMKSPPLKPDQPSLLAPASSPTFPPAATFPYAQSESSVAEPGTLTDSSGTPFSAGAAEAPPAAPRPLPDGHATTAAAMHPPTPAPTADPHTVDQ